MPTKRYSTDQVVSKLRQAEGWTWPRAARPADVQEAREQRADLLPVADQALDNATLQEVASGNF